MFPAELHFSKASIIRFVTCVAELAWIFCEGWAVNNLQAKMYKVSCIFHVYLMHVHSLNSYAWPQGLQLPFLSMLQPPTAAPPFTGSLQGDARSNEQTEVRACLLCMQGGGAEEPSNLAGELEPVSILISSKRLNKLDLTGASANKWQVLNQTEK